MLPAPPEPDLAALSLPELRALRRDAQRDEADLSYVRRLLQGRIDILRAELARRGPACVLAVAEASVVERLPEILTDAPARQRSSARHVTLGTPRSEEYRRLAAEMLGEVELSALDARTDAELADGIGTATPATSTGAADDAQRPHGGPPRGVHRGQWARPVRRADQRVPVPPRPPERRAAGRLFADESQKWPDTLWETVTRDPTLSW
ncbi:hypothetical protein SGLAM104S_03902 [Streptomyces glaucescens]